MTDCVAFSSVFTADEIASIRLAGEGALSPASVQSGEAAHRICEVGWITPEGWIGQRIEEVVSAINERYFGFDLGGFKEPFQYTVYGPGGHYGWHMDLGEGIARTRKLSLTVQLCDDYAGGDFEMNLGTRIQAMPKEVGKVIVFPSWMLHRVAPVTHGVRRSLVVWAHGAPFR